jgi:hypothetical protein
MHPIERLRWIARADGEDAATIATEAAWTLGELAVDEPAAVLTACRRLLERHPACGPLWWVAAHLTASDDPFETARRVSAELYSDTVPDRLAEAWRANFTATDVICVTSPSDLAREALSRRRPYPVRLVAGLRTLRHDLRGLGAVTDEVSGFEAADAVEALDGCAVLVVEASMAGSTGVLVPAETAEVVRAAASSLSLSPSESPSSLSLSPSESPESPSESSPSPAPLPLPLPVWLVLGIGRVLGPRLVETAATRSAGETELLEPGLFTLAVDAGGIGDVATALAAVTSPPGLELLGRVP